MKDWRCHWGGTQKTPPPHARVPRHDAKDVVMQVSFFGVRALVPVPGPATVRHGGNTACTLVRLSDGGLLILDCGTGARGLGLHLNERDFRHVDDFPSGRREATFLLSHPRWDRVQGFPFFRP